MTEAEAFEAGRRAFAVECGAYRDSDLDSFALAIRNERDAFNRLHESIDRAGPLATLALTPAVVPVYGPGAAARLGLVYGPGGRK